MYDDNGNVNYVITLYYIVQWCSKWWISVIIDIYIIGLIDDGLTGIYFLHFWFNSIRFNLIWYIHWYIANENLQLLATIIDKKQKQNKKTGYIHYMEILLCFNIFFSFSYPGWIVAELADWLTDGCITRKHTHRPRKRDLDHIENARE